MGSTGCSTPVEVSACTKATTLGRTWSIAAAIALGASAAPHSLSTRVTRAPARAATSHMRSPNTPATPTTTPSPGSRRFTRHASMPAEPVALSGRVSGLSVPKSRRSRSCTSSINARNCGSRWPTTGWAIASSTRAGALDGPGPRSRRGVRDMTGMLNVDSTPRGGIALSRWIAASLALALVALAAFLWLRPAPPHGEIDAKSRGELDRVLRDAGAP